MWGQGHSNADWLMGACGVADSAVGQSAAGIAPQLMMLYCLSAARPATPPAVHPAAPPPCAAGCWEGGVAVRLRGEVGRREVLRVPCPPSLLAPPSARPIPLLHATSAATPRWALTQHALPPPPSSCELRVAFWVLKSDKMASTFFIGLIAWLAYSVLVW